MRLQVLVTDVEMERLRVAARSSNISVGEWVRQAMRRALQEPKERTIESKLLAVKEARTVYAPTADIEQMIRETEEECGPGLP